MSEQQNNPNEQSTENQDNLAQNEEGTAEANALMPELTEEWNKVKQELDETKDKYLRLVAEFDNFKKRTAKERVDLIQTAGREVIQSLLVVLDDIDRSARQLESANDVHAVKEGSELVFSKIRSILQHKGLTEMDCAHQEFNADQHEAIAEIPAPSEELVGKVLDVLEKGYYLNDKLIRHAKVVVGK